MRERLIKITTALAVVAVAVAAVAAVISHQRAFELVRSQLRSEISKVRCPAKVVNAGR